jgi:hypothetical protein
MAPGGALANLLGPLIGTGKGRGVALLIALLGIAIIVASLLARAYRPLLALDHPAERTGAGPVPASPHGGAAT